METPLHVSFGQDRGEEGRPAPLTEPEVSIVVVSYNTRDYLRRCLCTVAESATSRPYEVLVIDNASQDDTAEMIAREFPEVRLWANRENVGYSRAVNQAIQHARGRHLLILNPDIEVLPGSIDELASYLDSNPEAGVVGGQLLNPDGTLQYSCRTFYTLRTLIHRRTPVGQLFPNSRVVRDHLMMDWDHNSVREVDWMLGACLMVRAEAIRDVGLMDERFFMYFEDVDWCYRMRTHGWKVVYVPQAKMKHVHQRESAKRGILNLRLLAHLNSMFRFFDKWNELLYKARKHRDLLLGALHLSGDVLAVNASFLAAFAVRSLLSNVLQRPVFPLSAYEPFILLANGVVLFVNATLGLYRHSASRDLLDDTFEIAKGLLFSTLILMASTFLTRSELHSRLMLGLFVPFAFATMVMGRLILASAAKALRRSRFDLVRVVVLGEREASAELARALERRPELGYEVVATLPDRPDETQRRFREFWDADGIRDVIHRHRVGEVLLMRPTLSDRDLSRIVLLCRRDRVRVRLVSGVADFLPGQLVLSQMLGRPVADLSALRGRIAGRRARRLIDTVLTLLALIPMGPLAWGRAARRVKESDEHELVHGLSGKVFCRRRFSTGRGRLAETLGHVLRGELALVGPRPSSPEFVKQHEELRVIFDLVRPGSTGLWRVHEGESLSVEEEISLAVSYLQNQNPLEDIKIVLRTLVKQSPPSRRDDS